MIENDYFYRMDNSIFNISPMIDLHTHAISHADRSDIVEIVSSSDPLNGNVYSLERHPWCVSQVMSDADQKELKLLLQDENCLALGEIGLDKLKGIAFPEQMSILRSLLKVADDGKIPVVIHCVKAFNEIILLKKEFTAIPNWVIHGFNKHPKLAEELIDHGFYLSINPQKYSRSEEVLCAIPMNRLFLETDNSSFLIEDNYIRAAKIVGMDVDELKTQISQNAKHFFGHE